MRLTQVFACVVILSAGFIGSAATASATPINGSVTFGGLFFSDAPGQDWTNATTFQFLEAQGHRSGDFDILGNFVPNPVPGVLRITDTSNPGYLNQGSQLINYNFDITSIAFTITSHSFLAQGLGIVNLTGFDPTFVTWSISAAPSFVGGNLYLATGNFVASGVRVSDNGATLAFLVGAICLLIYLRRGKVSGFVSKS